MLVICTAIARRGCSVLGWLLMVLVLLYFVWYEALWRRAQLCSEPTRGRQPDRHPRRRRGMLLLLTFKQSILLSTHPLTLSLPSHPLTRSPYCAVLCCTVCAVTPAQPSQAQPSPAQPSPAQPSPAHAKPLPQPNLIQFAAAATATTKTASAATHHHRPPLALRATTPTTFRRHYPAATTYLLRDRVRNQD